MLTHREIAKIEPRTAPDVGIMDTHDWPYGANICDASRIRLVEWATEHGYRVAHPKQHCLHWLTGQRRRCGALQDRSHPGSLTTMHSALDHPTFWVAPDGKPALLLAQPYHVERDVLDAIQREWPIDVTVTDESPWYGYTTKGVFLTPRSEVR